MPVDVTSGDSLKVEESRKTLYEHIKSGGFVMIPILAIAGIALILIIWKFFSLRNLSVDLSIFIEPILEKLRDGNIHGAELVTLELPQTLRPILAEGIEHRNAPKENIEEIIHERVLACIPVLEHHLGTLAVLGGVAPLLGLLGTVTGMIHTFQLVTIFGTGDAKLLSSGISEALVTTEFGLAIAIPVLLAHAFLSRRVRTIIGNLERAMISFVNRLTLQSASK